MRAVLFRENTHKMPWKKKTTKPRRKAGARRRPMRGSKVALPKRTTGNFATATEQFSITAQAGVVYDFTFNLLDAIRCNTIANAYQYYRITTVEMRFKPIVDTFTVGGAGAIPYLNFQYDKSGTLGNLTPAGFEEIGTKAVRLDAKTLIRKWKPSVLTDAVVPASGGATQFKVAPWLPVFVGVQKNDSVVHRGAIFYISKMSGGDATLYDIDVVVNVQYRKPAIPASSPTDVPAVNPPRIKQGNMTQVDLSLNPVLQS